MRVALVTAHADILAVTEALSAGGLSTTPPIALMTVDGFEAPSSTEMSATLTGTASAQLKGPGKDGFDQLRVITAVPEPGAGSLFLVSGLLALARRRQSSRATAASTKAA